MGIGSEQIDQPIRVPVRQRSYEDRIHQAEDGGACADAEGKREYGGDGETGASAQRAQAIASVLEKGIKPGQGAAFAMSLAGLLYAAETDQGLAARFLRR